MHRKYMEDAYEELAFRVMKEISMLGEGERFMVGIAGVPGSGKSTLAKAVAGRVNHLQAERRPAEEHVGSGLSPRDAPGNDVAIVVPMDGYHYTKAHLRAMPDPEEKFARRGAHWTFDGEAFLATLRQIRATGEASVPGFDHGVGDPYPGQIQVLTQHKAVLVEGNYVLFDEPPWSKIRALFDETWYVDCNLERAMDRVYLRQTGHGRSPQEAAGRIENNDKPNGQLIFETMQYADLVVESAPFREMESIW